MRAPPPWTLQRAQCSHRGPTPDVGCTGARGVVKGTVGSKFTLSSTRPLRCREFSRPSRRLRRADRDCPNRFVVAVSEERRGCREALCGSRSTGRT
jgi:hypothetical protein